MTALFLTIPFFNKNSKPFTICGFLLCVILSVALVFQILSTKVFAQSKKQYPEPNVRPDIREDAVWDSELGMYISGDCIKNSEGKYELNPKIFVCDKDESPEENWLESHADSENEIDMAILYSIELISKEAPSLYSAISPRSSEAILTAMRTISPSSYPEVWKRICTEPAYRPQKIVALEQFLGICFNDLGLYDSWAQCQWYDSFNTLKQELSFQSFGEITEAEISKYGNLLLPILEKRAKSDMLSESELKILDGLADNMSKKFYPDMKKYSIISNKTATEWFEAQSPIVEAIVRILQSHYEWVE